MNEIANIIKNLAKKIWDYHRLNQKLKKSDAILVLGCHDTSVADYGVKLLQKKLGSIIVFSGGYGKLTKKIWKKPEAEVFADLARKKGVPKDSIIIENKSTNTGENILFTKQLIKSKKININSFIVVTKPYMERRVFATFRKLWPEKNIIVTSPEFTFEEYLSKQKSSYEFICLLVGDLQRIKLYPKLGYQIKQSIPKEVWNAYRQLIDLGFKDGLLNNDHEANIHSKS